MIHSSRTRAASFVIVIVAMLVSPENGFAGAKVHGSGVVRTEQRRVAHFTTVETACTADVVVERGEQDSITVEAEENILPLIETNVTDGTLRLTTKNNVNISVTKGIIFRITARELRGVSITGSGSVAANEVDAKSFAVGVSGSGKVTVNGRAESLRVSISGSGSADTLEMPVSSAEVIVTGNAKVFVHAAERLVANVVGNGHVEYKGDPRVTKRVTGNGRVSAFPGD